MSETTMTPETGSGSLTVTEAAEKFASLMDTAEPSEQEQAEVVEQDLEADSTEESTEEVEDTDIEQEESETEEQAEPTYKVKIAGEEKTVTQSELIKLAQEGGDYTKKTQQLAEQRQALEREAVAIQESKQLRDAYAERLQMVEQMLSQSQAQTEDLEELKLNDPIGYSVRVAELTQQREQLNAIRMEQQRIAEQQQAEYAQQIQNYVAMESQKLAEAIPEYVDPVKGEALRSNLKAYAQELGFTKEELANVRDSRHVMALYKAWQYDQLQKSKPAVTKKVVEQQKTIKAGNSTSGSTANDNAKRDRQRLKETGRVSDAARLFERFL